ncbi:MAG: ribokinase [Lachnospiraceae bacterium]|nr:ribokinase [Lachnospiraceae bacterium]
MRIISFGSLNIDRVYKVEHFVQPGETISSKGYLSNVGGKGLNQSVAAAKAGIQVIHGGAVGEDGAALTDYLTAAGVDASRVAVLPGVSGHAIIQVDAQGRNCIIVSGGTNMQLSEDYIDSVLTRNSEKGDIVLLQNETSNVSYIIRRAHECGMRVAFNPSPIPDAPGELPLEYVDYLILNEIEGACLAEISDRECDFRQVLSVLSERFPSAVIVLTMGAAGSLCKKGETIYEQGIFKVEAVDTTAAGDTFCGYFLAGVCRNLTLPDCLKNAAAASSLAISKAGAAQSIPNHREVEEFLRQNDAKGA